MQLVAYGAQDVYLTGNPQITFWKVTYRRHTNFAMEAIEQTFNGQADLAAEFSALSLEMVTLLTEHTFSLLSLKSTRKMALIHSALPAGSITPVSSLSLWLRLRSVVSASTVSTVTGCTSGTSLLSPVSRRPDTTR